MDLTAELLHYNDHASPTQWTAFNHALATELASGLPDEEIRALFKRMGMQVAHRLPVGRQETLDALQSAFNEQWASSGWGVCVLEEQGAYLRILHACSPLAQALGTEREGWTHGFFEGVYQSWFDEQELPAVLQVRASPSPDKSTLIELRLARHT